MNPTRRSLATSSLLASLFALAAANCSSEVLRVAPTAGASSGGADSGGSDFSGSDSGGADSGGSDPGGANVGGHSAGGSKDQEGSSGRSAQAGRGGGPSVGGAAPSSAGAAQEEAGASGAGEGGTGPDFAIKLGLSCSMDEDCGSQLKCVRADQDFVAGIGAPPWGLCTARCQADSECKKLGPGAVCAALSEPPLDLELPTNSDEPRFCMQGCTLGAPADISKCHHRDAYACRPFAPPGAVECANKEPFCPGGTFCFRGYCRELGCGPRCEGDADCAVGRHCDAGSGLCVEHAVVATPIGTPCDPDAKEPQCNGGRCLVSFDDRGIKTGALCTQSCVLGESCGDGQGGCFLPRFENYAAGDIGYCQAVCDSGSDCKMPGGSCFPWDDAEYESYFGSLGVCEQLGEGGGGS